MMNFKQSIAFAVLLFAGTSIVYASDNSLQALQRRIALSEDVAYVTGASWPSTRSTPEFILVQDIHKHPEVQRHISQILLKAHDEWGLKKVFVEGAYYPVDLSLFRTLPHPTRDAVLKRMLYEGQLTGAEMAGATRMTNVLELYGVEDRDLYFENLRIYEEVQSLRETALLELTRLYGKKTLEELEANTPAVAQLERVRALMQLKLTPEEYQAYLHAPMQQPPSVSLGPIISAAETFYRLVDTRSDVFAKKLLSEPQRSTPKALVVGGFHIDAIAKVLREKGRSYIVISPRVTRSGHEPIYEKRMLESISTVSAATNTHLHQYSYLKMLKSQLTQN